MSIFEQNLFVITFDYFSKENSFKAKKAIKQQSFILKKKLCQH